ncbi:MAG: hypothetical protein H0X27_12690 [Caulobacteraceae bacterium]|nr:hypothetical protein [Caulobacteraceae bacterium]
MDPQPENSYGRDHSRRETAMSAYSVADAKAGLPRLIDRARDGEER